jgi:hypothetical protein
MAIFEDIKVQWGEDSYSCKAQDVFRMIAHLEDGGINIMEILSTNSVTVKCKAFSLALNFMGAKLTPEDVYQGLFLNGQEGALNLLMALQKMIVPPDVFKKAESMTDEQIKETSKKKPRTKAAKAKS